MITADNVRDVFPDILGANSQTEAVAPIEKDTPQRDVCAAAAATPPPALIDAADLAGIFARCQAALDRARVDGMYGSIEQYLECVWPRVQQRWALIEAGLAEVAADALSRRALRHEVALEDAWQRFEGQPEERDALFAMYTALVSRLPWPDGFRRQNLLDDFMLE